MPGTSTLLIAAVERSKAPFFFAGGVLVVWALASAAVGTRRSSFPGKRAGLAAYLTATVALVVTNDGARARDRGDGPGAAVGFGQRRRAQRSRRHRLGDHGVERAPARRRVDDAADGEQHLRDLRGQSGHRRAWRRVPPGPPVERLRGRPAQRAPPVVAYLQLAGHRAQRRRRVGRCGLRSDRRLRLRARRQDRTRAVAQRRAGPGRPQEGGRRAGKRFRDRHPAAGCQRPRLPVDRGAARWRHRLRARRQDRPDDLVVRHGARPSGRQGHRRRRLEPAGVGPDGTVYFGTGNMYQPATVALKTPGRRLYADSTVALDGKTGKLKWFYQAVPNDFHDWDLQLSPIYTKSDGRDILLEAGKMGYVYAVDPATGRLIWKTKVGVHNGHDDDGVLAMRHALRIPSKYTVEPGIVGGVETNMAVAGGVVYVPVANLASRGSAKAGLGKGNFGAGTGEMLALDLGTGRILWDTKLSQMADGDATVVNDLVFTTTFDGYVVALARKSGRIAWRQKLPAFTNAPIAIDDDTLITAASFPGGKGQTTEVIAFRLGAHGPLVPRRPSDGAGGGGAADGAAVFSQNCSSCHRLAAANAKGTVGPNLDDLKPTAAVVQRQVTDGGGGMPAFGGRLTKAQIDAVAKYVAGVAGRK